RGSDCDTVILKQALEETTTRRGSSAVIEHYPAIVESIRGNVQMRGFWERYQIEFDYAADISFDDVCNSVLIVMDRSF
ncbi:MAG: nucleotidyl transferase AbiEii/AbiGii toxin family protein, partial [Oscillospiraceae bacterium]|nr:nucleotidyl transferase AbiEii/AbiGii toxin family protein [Oscillospiraceae bacterium]